MQLVLQGDVEAQLDQTRQWDGAPLPSALWSRLKRAWQQVGALAGLTPTPYQSGQGRRELGIAKAGNRHIQAMAIEMAWAWRRFQPASALAQWYERRFGAGSVRLRKLGIVALARKLLIALWRFVKTGVLPEGAVLKTETRQ